MPQSIDRRAVLNALASSTVLGLIAGGGPGALAAQPGLKLGAPASFSFEALKALARRMKSRPYAPAPHPNPQVLNQLTYEAWGEITFDTDYALYKDTRLPVTFFHLGQFFQKPVEIYAVENGQSREAIHDQRYFHMPANSPAK